MKKLFYSLMASAIALSTFNSCEDVPEPYNNPYNYTSETIEPKGTGSAADPFNVSAALEKCTEVGEAGTTEDVYATGYVASISEISTSYGNATFTISDKADGSGDALTVYRAKGFNGESITDEKIVKNGDKVVICGKLVNFKGNTPEFTQGCYIVSVNGNSGGGSEPKEEETIGTKENPKTVADALAAINALESGKTTSAFYYVKGKVKTVKTTDENITKYKNIDYTIVDEGSTNELTVFRGKYLDNADFTVENKVKEGDVVIVYGKLKKYEVDGKITPEFDQGNYIVSLNGGGDKPSGNLGTAESPITVAKALETINGYEEGKQSDVEAYVKGKIVSVDSYNEKYKSITYYISDDGTETNKMQVYSGKGLNGADFSAVSDLKVGSVVVIKGYLKKYKNTPEIFQNNQIISMTEGGGDDPTPTGYKKVTTISTGNYVFAANTEGTTYAVAQPVDASKKYGWLNVAEVTASSDAINTDATNEFTFTSVDGGYTIQDASGRYYYMTGDYNSFNVSADVPTEGHVWTVTFDNDKVLIKNVLKGKTIQYSADFNSYGAYADVQGTYPTLFKK